MQHHRHYSILTPPVSASAVSSSHSQPVLRGATLASDSFLEQKKGGSHKGGDSKDKDKTKSRSKDKDDWRDKKHRDWDRKDRKGECWDRSADKCDKHSKCATFVDKKRGLLYCAPKDYRKKSSEVSFVATGDWKGHKGGYKGKLDIKRLRRLCQGDVRIKGLNPKEAKALRREYCGKKMDSEDYYEFYRKVYLTGHGHCFDLSRSACQHSKRCTLVKHGRKRNGHMTVSLCLPKKYFYDFEEESPSYDSEDSSYSEDFEDEDLFDSEDEDLFDSEDFDSEDFDSEGFDSEDFE